MTWITDDIIPGEQPESMILLPIVKANGDLKSNRSFSEITVTIKNEEKTYKAKHPIYEIYKVDEDDPIISDCIARALKDFNGEPTDIRIRINLVIL